jgi:hypothetical protein
MYYEELIKELRENNTFEKCLSTIINPFSLYYLCDHYFGDEITKYNIPIPNNKNDLFQNTDLSKIKDGDIIHCQVNYFSHFCNEILDKIGKKIILTTGQWHLPQIQTSHLTEKVITHQNVILWVSQNPIYYNNDKYLAFPYGIAHYNIEDYAKFLINNQPLEKNKEIIYLPINKNTHPCREKLPFKDMISPVSEYYKQMSDGKFILSPIGDRDDCYRHYEAIGLGTIPISNVNNLYKNIFTTNMVYVNIDEMVNMIDKDSIDIVYKEPNKDLICFEYYKNIVYKILKDTKYINK